MSTTDKRRLNAERSRLLTKLLTISKTATLNAVMAPAEIARIIAVVCADVEELAEMASAFPKISNEISPPADYYSLHPEWFASPAPSVTAMDVVDLLEFGETLDDDFLTYLKCLAEIHKRRRKYSLIMQRQPFPKMSQVSPRAIMEYGSDFPAAALASWLTWRKFFYDLDNRAAQETGYVFEPILASAIGGEPKSAREMVVRRSSDELKGRQVDCWKVLPDGTALAYEFKLRVTIAASGQGRFAEELSFAQDCQQSGVKPILVVLDPTENSKLTELQSRFKHHGGEAYVGADAWRHLENESGPTMARFIERYVRKPLNEISAFETAMVNDSASRGCALLPLAVNQSGSSLSIRLGTHERAITRDEDPRFAFDDPSDE